MPLPDPMREIRLVSLRTYRGASYWARFPLTRIDLAVGAYDEISSAEVPGFTEALHTVLPGLVEHRCSIGERGGFLTRLRRGTYAAHIVEHVAIELQAMAGHDVGFGKARGGDRPGEYTVVLRHRHSAVGERAALLALGVVQHAFAGRLLTVDEGVAELRALAAEPDARRPGLHVRCGVTGAGDRVQAAAELRRRGLDGGAVVADISPAALLHGGLPYATADAAVVLGGLPVDVPERYRDAESAARLLSLVVDGLGPQGVAVIPAGEPELEERVRDAGCRLALFSARGDTTAADIRYAWAAAFPAGGRVVLERAGETLDGGALLAAVPVEAQLSAALVHLSLGETPNPDPGGSP